MMAKSFRERMIENSDLILKNASMEIRKAAMAAHTVAVVSTPVDTGYARSRWEITIGAPIPTPLGLTSKVEIGKSLATTIALSQGRNKISGWTANSGDIYINNPVNYSIYLDAGSSEQAPAGITVFAIHAARKILKSARLLKGIK